MKELLAYIVENLVSDPAAIAITEEIDGDNITYSLRVAPGDMGSRYRSPRPHRKGNPHTHESGRHRETSASQLIFSTEPARIAPKC